IGDAADLALGQDGDARRRRPVQEAKAAGPQPDLGGALLSGRVEPRATRGERAPPAAGPAAEEQEKTGDEPAAEDAVELADAHPDPWRVGGPDRAERHGRGGIAGRARGRQLGPARHTEL